METKYIIAVLVIIVIVLAVIMGAMMMPSMNAQKDSKVAITSNKTLYGGDNLTVKLTDLNKTPIKKGVLNVTVFDKDGKVVLNKSLKTDSKGKATMKLDLNASDYKVNVTFGGDKNYSANSTSKKIKIIEREVVEQTPEPSQTASSDTSSQSSSQRNIDDMDGDGNLDVFYSEGYYDDVGMVQYYNTRGGEHLEVYEDGSYYYEDAQGSSQIGYL